MTYKQSQVLGGQVRKGGHSVLVVYADRMHCTDTDDNGDEIEREILFLKGYTVFNSEQIDGLPEHFYVKPSPDLTAPGRVEIAERFATATRADIRHGGNRAFYAIGADRMQLPPFESIADAESYYATLLHELTHWTRHPRALPANSGANVGAMKVMPPRSWSPSLARPFLRRSGDHAGAARRPCPLYRLMVDRVEESQAGDFRRVSSCAARCRLSTRFAGVHDRYRGGRLMAAVVAWQCR
jgi:hypothetical protein